MSYGWIDLGNGRKVFRKVERREVKRASLPSPMLNLDTMPETQSMLDGKFYTSKSALRATYRAAGVTEVGNDPARLKKQPKQKPDRTSIKTAVEKATARFNRGERADTAPRPL